MESAIQPSCLDCSFRPDRIFCDMPTDALQAFNAIQTRSLVSKGTMLFEEGKNPKGIFLLCDGRARLTVCSEQGKHQKQRDAGPGEVLGLGASLSGTSYE